MRSFSAFGFPQALFLFTPIFYTRLTKITSDFNKKQSCLPYICVCTSATIGCMAVFIVEK
ncbi:MAG TPA: hypothetical protein DDY77_01675 [Clostridiales bacterium]|nr:hypothetical protein [Clostridiales bacterium]